MVNQQLINYIKTEEAQGYTPAQLKNSLLQQGYNAKDVDEALNYANAKNIYPQAVPATKSTQKIAGGNAGIKRRNPVLVVLFTIITLGIYYIFWLVFTTNELRNNTKSAPNPWLILAMFIPLAGIIVMFIYYWKYCKAINELSGFSNVGLYLLWIFVSPVGMLVSQMMLNKKAQ